MKIYWCINNHFYWTTPQNMLVPKLLTKTSNRSFRTAPATHNRRDVLAHTRTINKHRPYEWVIDCCRWVVWALSGCCGIDIRAFRNRSFQPTSDPVCEKSLAKHMSNTNMFVCHNAGCLVGCLLTIVHSVVFVNGVDRNKFLHRLRFSRVNWMLRWNSFVANAFSMDCIVCNLIFVRVLLWNDLVMCMR